MGKAGQKLSRKVLGLIPLSDMGPDFFFCKGPHCIPDCAVLIGKFEIQRAPPPYGISIHGYSSMSARFPIPRRRAVGHQNSDICATMDSNVMKTSVHFALLLAFVLAAGAGASATWFHGKGKKRANQGPSATVTVESGLAGCKVDVDGEDAGETGPEGSLVIKDVEAGDHYVHVLCPGQRDTSYFISPTANQKVNVDARAAATNSNVAVTASINPAASEMELREMVSKAVQLRSSGQFKEAVELLRKATMLDPGNGDLHQELGITFLEFHDWESARVEMLEAIRREPDSVEAHSRLAYALEKLGDLDGALKQYRICTEMDPHDTSYRDHYVEVLGKLYAAKAEKKH